MNIRLSHTEPSTDVLRMVRIAQLEDHARSQSAPRALARLIGRVALTVILAVVGLPWWAIKCWWDLRAEDYRKEAERTRPRLSFASVQMGRGEARVQVRGSERATADLD